MNRRSVWQRRWTAGRGPALAAGGLALAFVAGLLVGREGAAGGAVALAQMPTAAGGRGVYAFTGQLDATHHGLFMLDIEQGTVWVYAIESVGGERRLRLVAARSWVFDRYLRDFNCAEPTYRQVQELVARQRSAAAQPAEGEPAPEPR